MGVVRQSQVDVMRFVGADALLLALQLRELSADAMIPYCSLLLVGLCSPLAPNLGLHAALIRHAVDIAIAVGGLAHIAI